MLLDTDFLIALLRKDRGAVKKLREMVDSSAELSITHINLCELYRGAYRSTKPDDNINSINQLLEFLLVLPFSIEADRRFGELMMILERRGKPIGEMDTLIAAIALEHNETILTRNIKHFKETGVTTDTF